jgi:hypothetical protein
MKNYPRIYSLSTLGLRQHQEFDYNFHSFRTDFIGESGSGKSMIADLLQLILVGSEAFISATEALGGKRTPDGMVLKTQDGRGTEIGYAFLNIQIAWDEYVVIGTYIESSSNTTEVFVIQQGYDENVLIPLNEPLSYKNFLSDSKVPPLDELKAALEIQGLVCKSWRHKKGYHKFLSRHNILTIDLSASDRILKDYAAIIQSFSRGKFLDTQKGDALKIFLYGEEAAKRIYQKYQQTVAEMQTSFNEHIRNKQEIDLVTQKQKKLSHLLKRESEMLRLKHEWLFNKVQYTYQLEKQLFEEVQSLHDSSFAHYQSLGVIQQLLTIKLNGMEVEFETKKSRVNAAKSKVDMLRSDQEKLNKGQGWLNLLQIGLDQLYDRYIHDKALYEMKTTLLHIDRVLQAAGALPFFNAIAVKENKAALIDFLDNEKFACLDQLQEKNALLKFWRLNDKGSLSSWALSLQRTFTLEEESLIMYFKELMTSKPSVLRKGVTRYISSPDMLIRDIKFLETDDNGGWLHYNGISEYIPWVKSPLFTDKNLQQLERFFESEAANLERDIKALSEKTEIITKLKEIVIRERNFDIYLDAIGRRQEAMSLRESDLIKLSEDELKTYIHVCERKEELLNDFLIADEEYNTANEEWYKIKMVNNDLQDLNKKLGMIITSNGWTGKLLEIHDALKPTLVVIEDTSQQLKYLGESYERAPNVVHFIRDQIENHRSQLNTFGLQKVWDEWKGATEKRKHAWKMYDDTYSQQPDAALFENVIADAGNEKEIRYESEREYFQNLYNEMVGDFLPNDAYRLKDFFDTVELGTALLPGAFREVSATSDNMIEMIDTYLKKINDKNKELNRRKIQKIKDILDDVSDEISDRITIAKQIDQFLNHEDKEITGGHRVRLTVELSREYPKNWIELFQSKLESEPDYGINDEVAEGVSLEEKIISVFQFCTTGNIGRPKIEKLLNPNAYLELFFSMKSSNGQLNKGSNGQSYAGIALLCIARLSVIGAINSNKLQPGIRFMPIDEAEGLGSNYDMLYNIAKAHDYQIISLSINPLGKFNDGEQYLYMLHKNMNSSEDVNNPPIGIFCEADIKKLSAANSALLS